MAGPALWLYRVLVHLALPLAAPVLWLKDRASGKSRPPLAARLGRDLPSVAPGGLLVHAVSVGEVEVARRLVRELRGRAPGLPLTVTITTATGLALARRTLAGLATVHPSPLDLPGAVRRVLAAVRPRAVVLVETELWPELLHQCARGGIPVAVVNGRLSDRSYRGYRRFRALVRPLLAPIDLVLARTEADAARFVALGVPVERVRAAGNLKYDIEPSAEPLPWRETVEKWAGSRPVLVAGSTMEGEETLLLEAVERLPGSWSRLFLVLAPRHPERFDVVAELLDARGVALVRRSALPDAPGPAPDVLLLDTIGELGRAYAGARAAFLGGSLVPTGGHNPLEPAAWGVPVLTGPHVHNFRKVYAELAAVGGSLEVVDAAAMALALDGWLADPAAAAAAGRAAQAVVERSRGAAARAAAAILRLAGVVS